MSNPFTSSKEYECTLNNGLEILTDVAKLLQGYTGKVIIYKFPNQNTDTSQTKIVSRERIYNMVEQGKKDINKIYDDIHKFIHKSEKPNTTFGDKSPLDNFEVMKTRSMEKMERLREKDLGKINKLKQNVMDDSYLLSSFDWELYTDKKIKKTITKATNFLPFDIQNNQSNGFSIQQSIKRQPIEKAPVLNLKPHSGTQQPAFWTPTIDNPSASFGPTNNAFTFGTPLNNNQPAFKFGTPSTFTFGTQQPTRYQPSNNFTFGPTQTL